MECPVHSGWQSLPLQVLKQWLWDNDRDAVLAEDADAERDKEAARARGIVEYRAYLESLTLARELDDGPADSVP